MVDRSSFLLIIGENLVFLAVQSYNMMWITREGKGYLMQLGIIGMPMVGKTTIFELLTENTGKTNSAGKANTAMARVPDHRIDKLSNYFKPQKTTYAQLEIVDIPGLIPGGEKSSTVFLDSIRRADALLQVVKLFDDGLSEINPIKDIENINYELLLADLDLIEKRIQRINDNKKKNTMMKELEFLNKLKDALENETHLSSIVLDEEEEELMRNYQFLTTKPMLICLNLPEDALLERNYEGRDKLMAYLKEMGLNVVEVSANIEKEISELDGEERAMFMEEMGLEESGVVRIARSIYASLGLISFFTTGEDEVKAWTITSGTPARKAAGKIHSDIERGFIRAEVVHYSDFETYGSMNALKEKGLSRLEGKEYIVKDGDMIHFRFNV